MPVKEMIDEAVANTNDDLLEKFLKMKKLLLKKKFLGLYVKGVMNQTLIPVLCGNK